MKNLIILLIIAYPGRAQMDQGHYLLTILIEVGEEKLGGNIKLLVEVKDRLSPKRREKYHLGPDTALFRVNACTVLDL